MNEKTTMSGNKSESSYYRMAESTRLGGMNDRQMVGGFQIKATFECRTSSLTSSRGGEKCEIQIRRRSMRFALLYVWCGRNAGHREN